MKSSMKKILTALVLMCGTFSASAQDLLANQAPIDTKLKLIDSVAVRRMLIDERSANPSAVLYGNWGEKYTRQSAQLPDSFLIHLSDFSMPTTSHVILSDFGMRRGRQHKGVDIKVYTGDTIRAAFSGKVRIVRFDPKGYGNYVVIRHHNGLETIYGHMSKNLVAQDQEIKAGTPIGLGGNTGRSATSHLHFETRFCGIALDPALMFDFRNQDVTGDTYMFCRNTTATAAKSDVASAKTEQKESEASIHYHKVMKGETLSSIARKRHTTVAELCRINHIGKSYRLRIGQILKYN